MLSILIFKLRYGTFSIKQDTTTLIHTFIQKYYRRIEFITWIFQRPIFKDISDVALKYKTPQYSQLLLDYF